MSGRDFAIRCLCVWMLTFCVAAHTESKDYEGERSRIEAQRQEQSRELDALEQQCHARFAVTDCVNRVRTQRRERMAVLDQRIAQINSAQRLEQAEQSRQSRREKLAQRQQREAEQAATSASAGTQTPSLSKASEPRLPAGESRGIDRAAKPGNAVDAATREARKARFLKKQQDAQERRNLRDQRLREPVPAHLALPVPP